MNTKHNRSTSSERRSTTLQALWYYGIVSLTLNKGQNLLVLLLGLALLHQVDFVLQDQDVLQLHDLDGSEMLRGLGLGTRLVARCSDHNGMTMRPIRQTGGNQGRLLDRWVLVRDVNNAFFKVE